VEQARDIVSGAGKEIGKQVYYKYGGAYESIN